MEGLKRILSLVLTVLMLFSCLPVTAVQANAAEYDSGEETEVYGEARVTAASAADSDALYDSYLTNLFYGSEAAPVGILAREELSPHAQKLYDALKEQILLIAAGETNLASITVTYEQLTEWGGTAKYAVSNKDAALAAFAEEFEINALVDALLHDCPYELYWFDKVSGMSYGVTLGKTSTHYRIKAATFHFQVVADHQAADYVWTQQTKNPTVDTAMAAVAAAAAENAKHLVAEHHAADDYGKLLAYKDTICELVTYNSSAASYGSFSTDADPWQLIYVFDNDPSTNVVCEGYAKAFQYLCDMSAFSGDIRCYAVTGDLVTAGGSGGHMWNIVAWDGSNYLVDVTNSDNGTTGSDGSLFLAGGNGTIEGGYVVGTVGFDYDYDMLTLWGTGDSSILKLAETGYIPEDDTEPDNTITGTCGENLTWVFDEDTGTLTISGTGEMDDYSYPDYAPWDRYENEITEVVLPQGLTHIGSSSFSGMKALSQIQIPDSVQSIGSGAFEESGITTVVIPTGITTLPSCIFSCCRELSSVTLPDTLTSIGYGAFHWCDSLTNLTIPESVTTIEGLAFSKNLKLETITIPVSVISIGEGVFASSRALKQVTFQGNAPIFDANAFGSVSTTIRYPINNPTWTPDVMLDYGGTITWKPYCIGEHTVIEDTAVDATCTETGLTAGSHCSACGEIIVVQETVDALGHTEEIIPGKDATCTETGLTEGKKCSVCGEITTPQELIAPNGHFEEIIPGVDASCTKSGLTEGKKCTVCGEIIEAQEIIDALGHTEEIIPGVDATCSETGLTEGMKCSVCGYVITLQEIVPVTDFHIFVDGICEFCNLIGGSCGTNLSWVFEEGTGTLTISGTGKMEYYSAAGYQPWYKFSEKIKKVVIKDGITRVGLNAFRECFKLTHVELPESITSIDGSAFYECEALKEITIPESVTSLGAWVFSGCTALETVNLPSGLTEIASGLFSNCHRLKALLIPEAVITIGEHAFSNCYSLSEIIIPNSVTTLGSYAFYGCTNLTSITLPANIKKISSYLLSDCSNLQSIVIPERVVKIDTYAFSGCSSLTSIDIPEGVTNIENGTFSDCSALTSIDIPDGVISIGMFAFQGCHKLASLVIPKSVTSIGRFAFSHCNSLASVDIPEGITIIEDATFNCCSSLTSVTIPSTVSKISTNAFASTSLLKEIYFKGNACEIADSAFGPIHVKPTAYYPAGNTTWTKDVMKDYFIWKPYCYVEHTIVEDAAVDATCTENGLTEGKKCSVCGEILVAQEVVPATGVHRYVNGSCGDCGVAEPTEPTVPDETEPDVTEPDETVPETTVPEETVPETTEPDETVPETTVPDETVPETTEPEVTEPEETEPDVTEPVRMEAPQVKGSNAAASGKPRLTWVAVEGAVKYEIWRSTKLNSGFTKIYTQKGTTYTNTKAEAGKLYYYKVVAVDGDGNRSDFSNRVSRTCDLKRPTVKISNDAATGKVKLTWEKIDGAVKYKVYRATAKNGKYSLMKTVTGTSYINNSAKVGKKYFYKVVAVHENTNANSAYSAIVSRMCDLARPAVTVKRNDAGKPRISWQKVEGAVKYEVYRSTSKNGKYTKIATTKNLYQVNKNAKAGVTYYYKVKAVHSNTNANSALSLPKYIKAK